MDPGEWLTRWTVRLALALYVTALGLRIAADGRPAWWSAARWAWTLGCGAFLVHVACAFQYYHHWSHAAAYEATALRTDEVVHLRWGGGLYGNYAFALVWVGDALAWWTGLHRYTHRSRAWTWAIQGFMGFMFFNATLVFGHGTIRWMAVVGMVALGALGLRNRRMTKFK